MGDNGEEDPNHDDCSESSDASRPERAVTLSLDATLELLANHDRRAILTYLMDAPDRTATVDELVEHLVTCKADRTGERPGHHHVLTTVYHIHVPKLVDAGVVDYDARSQELCYWGSERLEEWHERIRNQRDE